jgi:23S rRNA-/tRNA-specific pseudouridylate synthase
VLELELGVLLMARKDKAQEAIAKLFTTIDKLKRYIYKLSGTIQVGDAEYFILSLREKGVLY